MRERGKDGKNGIIIQSGIRNTGIEPLSHLLIAWFIHILEIIQSLETERTCQKPKNIESQPVKNGWTRLSPQKSGSPKFFPQ